MFHATLAVSDVAGPPGRRQARGHASSRRLRHAQLVSSAVAGGHALAHADQSKPAPVRLGAGRPVIGHPHRQIAARMGSHVDGDQPRAAMNARRCSRFPG